VSYITRSLPRERDDEAVHEPAPSEPCHCGEHGEGERCPAAEFDVAMERALDLVAAIRAAGGTVTTDGATVSVRGVNLDAGMLEALKGVKAALLVLLRAES
jgi:hypothetical protein